MLESNNISKFYVDEGEEFSNTTGVWVDKFYAEKNNLGVGDEISFKYDDYTWTEKIKGVVYVSDHIYTLKDSSQLMPNYEDYGSIFISYVEVEDYMGRDKIPYNYIMVDVDSKDSVSDVKNEIEKTIGSAIAEINIEDTASYTMFQGEIDEAKSFVGIFSGLFLGIAFLSVITTMTRVIKNKKPKLEL